MYLFSKFGKNIDMKNTDKQTMLKILFINSILIIFTNAITMSNLLIKQIPSMTIFIPAITLIILLLLSFFLPKFKKSILKYVNKNIFIKIVLIIYLTLSTLFILTSCFNLISRFFYIKTPIFLIILTTVLGMVFLSKMPLNRMLNLFFFILILVVLYNFLKFITISKGTSLIIDDINFNYNPILIILSTIFPYLDTLILYLFISDSKPLMNKKTFIYSSIIITFFTTYSILENFLYLPPTILSKMFYPVLFKYKALAGGKYFDNLTNILFTDTIILILFKGAINLYTLRILLNLKHKSNVFVSFTIVFTLLLTGIYYLKLLEVNLVLILGYILSGLLFIFYFYLIYLKRKVKDLV